MACCDTSISLYLDVNPFGLEPASVAIPTNGLKVWFPLKDKYSEEFGSRGVIVRNGSSYELKPGSMHQLCVRVCECVVKCVSG